jgi:hypothetical protein
VNGTDYGSTSGQGGSIAQQSIGDCIPHGWDLLNPLAYVKGSACMFLILFIPSNTSTAWENFRASVAGHPPWSLVAGGTAMIQGVVTGVNNGNQGNLLNGGGGTIHSIDPTQPDTPVPNFTPLLTFTGADCSGSPYGAVEAPTDCTAGLPAGMGLIRTILRVGLWVGFLFLIWRRANAAMGAHTEADDPA